MKYVSLILCLLLIAPLSYADQANDVVDAARERTAHFVTYQSGYVRLKYPGGDVPSYTGVCTDVIIRTFRNSLNFDFQKAVHEDMKANFSAYPKIWGHKGADKNIDHRRVPNLERFLTRQDANIAITQDAKDYLPGDIVSWRLYRGGTPHIGIVTDKKAPSGTPLIVHNIGSGPKENDMLFDYEITGHFRYFPAANMPLESP